MATRVLILLGSPRRKGNSETLALALAEGARRKGAHVEMVRLNALKIRPCQGCGKCQEEGAKGCVQKDDMTALYPKVLAADALVVASPIYWFSVSAQAKLFIDRLYAIAANDKGGLRGTRLAVILTYGDADPFFSGAVNAMRMFQDISAYLETDLVDMVHGSADAPGEVGKNRKLMTIARRLGERIASGGESND